MKALVTGASSGIGRDIARALVCRGWDVILVARRADRLMELKKELGKHARCVRCDVSHIDECMKLHEVLQNEDIEMVVNCAGFGLCGFFTETSLEKEMDMIDTNIRAVHVLTKLFLQDFMLKNKGYILNVASSAAFQPGPLMSTYYATKSYVYQLTEALYYEEKVKKKDIGISVLCPGPVDTNFNNVAGVKFGVKPLDSKTVAEYAIDKMFKKKMLIIPGTKMKLAKFFSRFLSDKALLKMTYKIQKKKVN